MKSRPWARTSGSASRWLDTTTWMVICAGPGAVAEQQVVEAVQVFGHHDQRVRYGALALHSSNVMSNRDATSAKSRRSSSTPTCEAPVIGQHEVQPHEEPAGELAPNCWLSTMPAATHEEPETAWTTPGWSLARRISRSRPTARSRAGVPSPIGMVAKATASPPAPRDGVRRTPPAPAGRRRPELAARSRPASSVDLLARPTFASLPPLRIQRS